MTITQRLLAAFTLLFAAIILQAIMAITLLSGFQDRFEHVQTSAIPSVRDLGKLIDESNQLSLALYQHQSQPDSRGGVAVEARIRSHISSLTSLTRYYLNNDALSDQDRQLSGAALEKIRQIEDRLPAFLSASGAHRTDESIVLIEGENGPGAAIRQLLAGYQHQLAHNISTGDGLRETNRKIFHFVFWATIAGVAATVVLFGIFSALTILRIRRSLSAIGGVMMTASEHLDLTVKADDSRRDEIGNMARSFNMLMSRVAAALSSVSQASQSVSSASVEISAGNEDLSSRTEQQAASLEQTASSMTQLNETVRQTADNTRQASELADNTRDLSNKSADSLGAMIATMEDIRHSSRRITDIVSLIEGIAFQTNILALNAAVEAARAGESGKGFAVVAGEVRNLSQRSTAAAQEIKTLIEESHRLTETGAAQAGEVGRDMNTMQDAVTRVSGLVSEIASAAVEQSQGIAQVLLAVNQMDDVTQQNAALVEQAAAASQSLQEQATTLNQLVGKFIVNDENSIANRRQVLPVSRAGLPAIKPAVSTEEADWQSF